MRLLRVSSVMTSIYAMQQNYLVPSLRVTPEASGRTGERRAVFCLLKSRPNPRRELKPRCKNTSWEDTARNTEVTDQARLRSDPGILKCFVVWMELSGTVQESCLDLSRSPPWDDGGFLYIFWQLHSKSLTALTGITIPPHTRAGKWNQLQKNRDELRRSGV